MSGHELSYDVDVRRLPLLALAIAADEEQRSALAKRFGVTAVHSLAADVSVTMRDGAALVRGRMVAEVEQPCAVTGEEFRYTIAEDIGLKFVPAQAGGAVADEEIELKEGELDEIEYEGHIFDLGEAIAQTLGLAIDPYAEGPNAEEARKAGLVSSEEASGPFAALSELKKDS